MFSPVASRILYWDGLVWMMRSPSEPFMKSWTLLLLQIAWCSDEIVTHYSGCLGLLVPVGAMWTILWYQAFSHILLVNVKRLSLCEILLFCIFCLVTVWKVCQVSLMVVESQVFKIFVSTDHFMISGFSAYFAFHCKRFVKLVSWFSGTPCNDQHCHGQMGIYCHSFRFPLCVACCWMGIIQLVN